MAAMTESQQRSPRYDCWSFCFLVMVFAGLASTAMGTEVGQDWNALREQAKAYEYGEGVSKDQLLAAQMYCEAARAGDAESQFSLGWMYANGRGVVRDDSVAAYFFDLAARQGHSYARHMLGFVGSTVSSPPECMRNELDDLVVNDNKAPLIALVRRLAPEYGINPQLALAVVRAESNFDALAVSSKNAQGLMQLIPETSIRFNVRKPFDPEQNVRGGLAYLRWLLAYFKGNVALVAAGYNSGEGTVNRFRGIPPFTETREYVKRILSYFHNAEHPYDARITEPSPELSRIVQRKIK